jgi:hypothetical protein
MHSLYHKSLLTFWVAVIVLGIFGDHIKAIPDVLYKTVGQIKLCRCQSSGLDCLGALPTDHISLSATCGVLVQSYTMATFIIADIAKLNLFVHPTLLFPA